MTRKVLTWDWKDQVDFDDLAAAIAELSNGTLSLHQIDTDGDDFAVVIANEPTTRADAQGAWLEEYA